MNTYSACKSQKTLLSESRTTLLLSLNHAAIVCICAAVCAAIIDFRLAAAVMGGAVLLLGCILILSVRRLWMLLLGAGTAVSGMILTAWGIWRLVNRHPLPPELHNTLTAILVQVGFFTGGIALISIPIHRINRAARKGMLMVKAQCIASIPEQDCILWRYRVSDQLYDWRELHCASFLLPCMGDCCILYTDPDCPEKAVRIDRKMAAAQMGAGLLLVIESIAASAANL